jgi:hypothetical protein
VKQSKYTLANCILGHPVVLVLGLAVIVFAVGCSTATEITDFPTGRFVNEVRDNRVFEFFDDGTWSYYEGNLETPAVSGTYEISGNQYTELTHDYAGLPQIPATYFWEFDGSKLTFHLSGEDTLTHRRSCYDGQTYILIE